MSTRQWVERHRRIKKAIDQMVENTEGDVIFIRVSYLAKTCRCDPRTIRSHLEVMQIDGVGKFYNKSFFYIEGR